MDKEDTSVIGIGVVGLGSVFMYSYRRQIERLARAGRVELRAVYDIEDAHRKGVASSLGLDPGIPSEDELIRRDDVDLVMVLTSMPAHGRLSLAALKAGKHVFVEKPMATTLAEAAEMLEIARAGRSKLLCAPHILLSPTYREMWQRVRDGVIGELHLGRARYGWRGPWWGPWFYKPGGGSVFDLGCYNITSLIGFFGSARRVTAMMGTRIPQRTVDGQLVDVEVDDNVQILIDHGDNRYSSVMTGFTLQRYRSPAVELYGATGSMQMMGHDWAPEGFEQWRNEAGVWEIVADPNPFWHWTVGLDHLIDALESGGETVTRPEQAYHALEVMLAAKQSAAEGRVVEIESEFPQPDYSSLPPTPTFNPFEHDPRSAL
jgi:predicted dehydrogenase